MSDLPIGFGVAAKATAECRHADPMNVIAFHQVKYIRNNILPPGPGEFNVCNVPSNNLD